MHYPELILFPLDGKIEYELTQGNIIRPRTRLQFHRSDASISAQLHQIEGFPPPTIPTTPFPKGTKLQSLVAGGLVQTVKDAFWLEPLCFVEAWQLNKLKVGEVTREDREDYRHSIKAYIATLPAKTRVLVYWED